MVDAADLIDREAHDLLLLDALPGVGPATVRSLVRRFGTAAHALVADTRAFAAVAGDEAERARRDASLRQLVRHRLDEARARGIHATTWSRPGYPAGLRHLSDPPPVLFLRGDRRLLDRPGVTVVGARRATGSGRDVAERLGAALAGAGIVVTSGLALGVDGAAHRGALGAGGPTLAVLGTGADVAYPAAHRALFTEIARSGLLVSEFLPGTRAAPHHFPRRNRILAALASTVVVVEAGARSGALITVDHALDLGRDVWAVPGPIDRRTCAGSNRLLVDGARPLVSIDAFVREVQARSREDGLDECEVGPPPWVADASDSGSAAPRRPAAASDPHDPIEKRVLAAVRLEAASVDELAGRLGLPVQTALAVLTTLELHGEVRRLPGLRFRGVA